MITSRQEERRPRTATRNAAAPLPDDATLPRAAIRVDAVGLLCPVPITRTARAIHDLPAGEVLELCADDRVVLVDLPNWCRSWRHEFLGHVERGRVIHLFVRKDGKTA